MFENMFPLKDIFVENKHVFEKVSAKLEFLSFSVQTSKFAHRAEGGHFGRILQ